MMKPEGRGELDEEVCVVWSMESGGQVFLYMETGNKVRRVPTDKKNNNFWVCVGVVQYSTRGSDRRRSLGVLELSKWYSTGATCNRVGL
uniref:Uncharacterized protein n=1 Tax=Arundo donax TaxID=35708 RepID=A0A0A9C7Q2_ARUDO